MGCAVKACVFPIVDDGLCAHHLRDKLQSDIPMGIMPPPEMSPKKLVVPSPWETYEKPKRYGNNVLKPEKKAAVIEAFKVGLSLNATCIKTGVARCTARKIRDELIAEGTLSKLCACGRKNGHTGLCVHTVEQAPARQKTVRKMQVGKTLLTNIERLYSHLEESKQAVQAELDEIDKQMAAVSLVIKLLEEEPDGLSKFGQNQTS
jgi:hypothetical protein